MNSQDPPGSPPPPPISSTTVSTLFEISAESKINEIESDPSVVELERLLSELKAQNPELLSTTEYGDGDVDDNSDVGGNSENSVVHGEVTDGGGGNTSAEMIQLLRELDQELGRRRIAIALLRQRRLQAQIAKARVEHSREMMQLFMTRTRLSLRNNATRSNSETDMTTASEPDDSTSSSTHLTSTDQPNNDVPEGETSTSTNDPEILRRRVAEMEQRLEEKRAALERTETACRDKSLAIVAARREVENGRRRERFIRQEYLKRMLFSS